MSIERLRPLSMADSAKLGERIATVARDVARTPNVALAAIVVIDGDGTPSFTGVFGRNVQGLTRSDVSAYLNMAAEAVRSRQEGESPNDAIRRRHEHRVRVNAAAAARQAAENAERPWQCESCGRRYKTRGGAERHEARCLVRPWGDRHRVASGQINGDGWVWRCRCGFESRIVRRGAPDPAMRAHFHDADRDVEAPSIAERNQKWTR